MDWRSVFALFQRLGTWLLACLASTTFLAAEEPLPVRIDQLVEADQPGPVAAIIGDEEFARRIYLDLTGCVPSVSEVRTFLADSSPNKRILLIDRLLSSPQYIRHMATTLDVMLMERRGEKHVKLVEWRKYLYDSVSQNKPWNQLVREILNADGTDEKTRAAARFYLDREGEPNLLTRDVGRMLFGMDLGCCQCHDHPLVSDYEQSDYYGIFAFLSRSALVTDKDKKVLFAERAEGDVKFTSVFTKAADEMRPRLPGDLEIDEPAFVKGDEYLVAPADGVRSVPKFSRRAKLAELASNGTNRAFSRNMVNRLWALMMGRGLVEPVDMHHVDNPPSHPELLELLSDEFVKMNFDIKTFLRTLAWTNTYQRSVQPPSEFASPGGDGNARLASLEADSQQKTQALSVATETCNKARAEYETVRKLVTSVLGELGKANESLANAQKVAQDAAKGLAEAQQQLTTKKDVLATVGDSAKKIADAAAKLPQEKQLAEAAGKFQMRAAQLANELSAAEKLVVDRTPAANSAAAAVTVAKTAAAAAIEKITATKQQLHQAQQPLVGLAENVRAQQVAVLTRKTRLEGFKSIQKISAARSTAQASRNRLSELEGQVNNSKQTIATLTTQLTQFDAACSTAKTNHDEAAKRLAEVQSQFSDKQQTVALLSESLAKAEQVTQKLPQDVALKQAVDALKIRRDQLATELTATQSAISAGEQSAKAAADQLAAAQKSAADARTQLDAIQKSVPQLEAQTAEAKAKSEADEAAARAALDAIQQRWTKRFLVAPLEPLTPEQMGWSILKVTGVIDQYRAAAEVEVNKTMPVDPNAPPDTKKSAERERAIEQQVFEKLHGNVATFVSLFGHAGGQPQRDFFATVDQALFFANGGVLQSWLNPSGENLVGRAVKLTEPKAVADELYLSVLTRRPTDAEVAAIAKYLEGRTADRPTAIQEIAWALITSIEFRFH